MVPLIYKMQHHTCCKQILQQLYIMIHLLYLEEEERFSQLELNLESAGLSAFSNKLGFEIEGELENCTILTNFSE